MYTHCHDYGPMFIYFVANAIAGLRETNGHMRYAYVMKVEDAENYFELVIHVIKCG